VLLPAPVGISAWPPNIGAAALHAHRGKAKPFCVLSSDLAMPFHAGTAS
jgi:hypothetical protein